MRKRPLQFWIVAAVLALAGAGLSVALGQFALEYSEYRRIVEADSDSSYGSAQSEASFGEFLEYRRIKHFYDSIRSFEERQATSEEVREGVGEPDDFYERPGEIIWFYSGKKFRGRIQPTAVLDIDRKKMRVVRVHYIISN